MRIILGIAVVIAVFGTQSKAFAQEQRALSITWRTDLDAALREAQKANLPLFVDFSTSWCGYCRKLDATTFRDPQVMNLLVSRFIPVKLDGDTNKKWVDTYGVNGYPTLLFLNAQGRVIKNHRGYLTGVELAGLLTQIDQAYRASIPATTKPPRTIDAEVTAQRKAIAAEHLALARRDYQLRLDMAVMDRCLLLLRDYAETAEAQEARKLATLIRDDRSRLQTVTDNMSSLVGDAWLVMADDALRRGEKSQAVVLWERITVAMPGLSQAASARAKLADMQSERDPTNSINQTSVKPRK